MIVVIASLLSFVESIKVFGAGFFKTADLFFVPRTDVGPALRLADFVDIKVGKALIVADLVGEAVGSFVGTAIVGVFVGLGAIVGRGVGVGVGGAETCTFIERVLLEAVVEILLEVEIVDLRSFRIYIPGPLKPGSLISIFVLISPDHFPPTCVKL